MEKWWSKKYRLPPNHPLFLELPLSEHLMAFYEDQMDTKEMIESKLKHAQLNHIQRIQLLEQLRELKDLLDEKTEDGAKPSDPLSKFWEEQIARGEEPDLDLTLVDLRKMGKA